MLDVDALAQEIRRVDGSNSLGAGALAESLMPFVKRQAMANMDAAFNAEIERVSTIQYNSNAICRHFYDKMRERMIEGKD